MKTNIFKIICFFLPIIIGTGVTAMPAIAQDNQFTAEALREDFSQFRNILENEHCCLYEFTPKTLMDSLFNANYQLIDHDMEYNEFFMLLAPITAKIGCMHTAAWMHRRFFVSKPNRMFPFTLKLIDEKVIVTGSYLSETEIARGSILFEINDKPVEAILEQLRNVTQADALNPYFVDGEIMERFSLQYASVFGLPGQFKIKFLSPGKTRPEIKIVTSASHEQVNNVVYYKFSSPPLGFEIVEEKNTAILKVPTFIYYDKVDYFRNFMDSCFQMIKKEGIDNLILDVRGNDGGDPFCSSILLSYLEKSPVPYFAAAYHKYEKLAEPLPLPDNHFKGNLYTLVDGGCGSTNGHFCALLKYNKIGHFVGTPSGATYKCNAGKDTEFRLNNTQIILTIGRSTYAAAVKDMPKTAIMPDFPVTETYDDFLDNRDVFMEKAAKLIEEHYR